MKYFIFLFIFLLVACTSSKTVYWCGDHECISNKERKTYFKDAMIVEVREKNVKKKKETSEIEKITEQALLNKKTKSNDEKKLAKLSRLEEKRKIKEEKKLAKLSRLEEKRKIKEEKKQAKLAQRKAKIGQKKIKTKKASVDIGVASLDTNSKKFRELVNKITKKNKLKPYPNINDIPK